jgi:hypothetical protein
LILPQALPAGRFTGNKKARKDRRVLSITLEYLLEQNLSAFVFLHVLTV